MEARIIVDSCCDLLPPMRKDVHVAPLKITVNDVNEYVDDGTTDIPTLIADMAATDKPARSACPSPQTYLELMRGADTCFVITLSSRLSGSYNAATLARNMALEENPQRRIHVFDSESASAGEVTLLFYLQSLLALGLDYEAVIEKMDRLIARMHTLFVLEDLGNLVKNGRLNKIAGKLATALAIHPLLSDDGHGEIKMMAMARGMKSALRSLVTHIGELTKAAPAKSVSLVLTFCNCPQRAQELRDMILAGCEAIRDVVVIPTGALSSMYANDGGVIVAFEGNA